MNARTDTHAARSFEAVSYSDWSYTMTEADIAERFGLYTIEDRAKHTTATIYRIIGDVHVPLFSLALDTPLCRGCDGVIENHLCLDCELAFGDPQ